MTERPPPPPRTYAGLAVCLALAALFTAADLGTKAWAHEELSAARRGQPPPVCEPDALGRILPQRARTTPVVLVDGVLEFRYAENCGAAFGFLREAPSLLRKGVFYLAAGGAVLLLPFMFLTGRGGPFFAASVPLIVAGALGNLHDRIRFGYVVDFIRFHLRDGFWLLDPGWEYPTFNVADIWITIGVVFILIDGYLDWRRERAELLAAAAEGSPAREPGVADDAAMQAVVPER